MKKTEHAIEEQFTIDHIIYKVMKADSCKGCALCLEDENQCMDYARRFEHCSRHFRKDNQDVKFVKIGEED